MATTTQTLETKRAAPAGMMAAVHPGGSRAGSLDLPVQPGDAGDRIWASRWFGACT